MARKRLRNNMARLKRKDDNFFALPEAVRLPMRPRQMAIKARGCKPNTRYKVCLDNFPGRDFEDIQHTARPIGESIKNNPRPFGNRVYEYLKSDEKGEIVFSCLPFGSDAIDIPANPQTKRPTRTCWSQFKLRTKENDVGRDRVCLIEAGQITNPYTTDKIKQVKFDYESSTVADQGVNKGTNALPPGVLIPCFFPPIRKKKIKSPQEVSGTFYQTFYINSKSVGGAKHVDITDVILYLRRKPNKRSNKSGTELPGITVSLMETNADGSPRVGSVFQEGVSTVEWRDVDASPLATTGTRFDFQSPVTVETNKSYAIAVVPESEEYVFWFSQKGDLLLVNGDKTERRSSGSSKRHQGDYYPARTSTTPGSGVTRREKKWQPDQDLDLKFKVNVAEYSVGDTSIQMINGDYEFVQLTAAADTEWMPGEVVYKENTPLTGTATIVAGRKYIDNGNTGDYSTLLDGDVLIVESSVDDTQVQVFTVDATSFTPTTRRVYVNEYAETSMSGTVRNTVVGQIDHFDLDFKFLRLEHSSVSIDQYLADNTMRFAPGDTIRGVESRDSGVIDYLDVLDVSVFRPSFVGEMPDDFKITTSHQFSELDSGSIESGTGNFSLDTTSPLMYLNGPNKLDYAGLVMSKSLEVLDATDMHNPSTDTKSSVLKMNFSYTGANTKVFEAPSLDIGQFQVVAHRFKINNDSTNEHTNNGNALTKHISKKLDFNGQEAEDVRVILSAFKPRQTDVEVYAKILNSSDSAEFDDKYWTKLEQISNLNGFSAAGSLNDYREYEYSFPASPPTLDTAAGEFTTTLDSAVITGSSSSNVAAFSVGQTIKLYSPLFPTNYSVYSIQNIDIGNDQITVNETVSNNSIVGTGFKIDTLETEQTAFHNPQNDGIVRYFGANGESYDNYNTVAIKIVLLAENRKLTPRVDDFRLIGVTA